MQIEELLDKVDDETDKCELVVEDVVEALESRGYGPMLLFVALLALMPTGAIPTVPTVVAVLIILISGQMLMGRKHPWLPKFLRERGIEKEKFRDARDKTSTVIEKLDRVVKPRMHWVFHGPVVKLVAGTCLLIAMTMPPLELLPFAVFVPAAAIGLFGAGLTVRDGLLIILGFVLTFATFIMAFTMLGGNS